MVDLRLINIEKLKKILEFELTLSDYVQINPTVSFSKTNKKNTSKLYKLYPFLTEQNIFTNKLNVDYWVGTNLKEKHSEYIVTVNQYIDSLKKLYNAPIEHYEKLIEDYLQIQESNLTLVNRPNNFIIDETNSFYFQNLELRESYDSFNLSYLVLNLFYKPTVINALIREKTGKIDNFLYLFLPQNYLGQTVDEMRNEIFNKIKKVLLKHNLLENNNWLSSEAFNLYYKSSSPWISDLVNSPYTTEEELEKIITKEFQMRK